MKKNEGFIEELNTTGKEFVHLIKENVCIWH